MEHEDNILQPETAFKKASEFVRRNMYDLIVLLIVLVNIAQGFARISTTGKTITEILGDGFITLVLSFTIARIFDIKGLDRGERDDSYLTAMDAYREAAAQCKPYAAQMDGWCKAYNARRRRELQETILLSAGISYETFASPGFDIRKYTKEQQYYIRKARRVKFYELSTRELTNGLHDGAHESEYERATKTDYLKRSSMTDVASQGAAVRTARVFRAGAGAGAGLGVAHMAGGTGRDVRGVGRHEVLRVVQLRNGNYGRQGRVQDQCAQCVLQRTGKQRKGEKGQWQRTLWSSTDRRTGGGRIGWIRRERRCGSTRTWRTGRHGSPGRSHSRRRSASRQRRHGQRRATRFRRNSIGATAATAGEEAAKVQQSITGSLRPRNANVAPTDPSTGIRVSSGNTGNSGNASRTLGSGTGTASQYPALESYQRTLDSMGRRGLLTGATAAGWNASHPTEAAAVRLNELIAANRPAGTTGSTANSAGTGNTSAASAGRNSGNTAAGIPLRPGEVPAARAVQAAPGARERGATIRCATGACGWTITTPSTAETS